jgi:hypothetical protein
MITRSKSTQQQQLLEVNIDFNEASNLWNANKKKIKNCCYNYVCGKELSNGCYCKKSIYKFDRCRIHQINK